MGMDDTQGPDGLDRFEGEGGRPAPEPQVSKPDGSEGAEPAADEIRLGDEGPITTK